MGSGTRAVTVEVPEELFDMLKGLEAEYGVTPEEYLKEGLLPLLLIALQLRELMTRSRPEKELGLAVGYL